jgi:hypothetical protein
MSARLPRRERRTKIAAVKTHAERPAPAAPPRPVEPAARPPAPAPASNVGDGTRFESWAE